MRTYAVLAALMLGTTPVLADDAPKYPATLAGHAIVPAATTVTPPADAPADLKTTGKFTAADSRRVDTLGAVKGATSLGGKGVTRLTGSALPIEGQSFQGLSGIKTIGDGTYWVLTDNGFGAKANSYDAMLYFHRVKPDFATGKVEIVSTTFLHDPDKKVPFRIVNEATDTRYLTGADFDIEAIQPIGDGFWFGDELGPYLIHTDRAGKVLAVYETMVDGKLVKSPDHFTVSTPSAPTGQAVFTARRSRGFEGMAASKDGKFLYALLEAALWDPEKKDYEKVDGRAFGRILEFDVAKGAWTGRYWKYVFEDAENHIGDFNMIDGTTGLVIERDEAEGDLARACPADKPAADCFAVPARFKRIYKIELTDATVGDVARKIGYIDLLDIKDPKGLARQGGKDKTFAMPFVTIENVDTISPTQIIVANDNNFPFSAGREPGKQDDNEFVILDVAEFLAAK